jgi:uncharacterized protein (TIGR02246 family)
MLKIKQDPDVASINDVFNEYAGAINAGDMDRWISLWIDDGLQMPPDVPRNIGKEQIQESNRPLFDLYDSEMTVNPDEIRVLGDRAYAHGTYNFAMTPKEEGEVVKGTGKFLTILERQVDGSWKIAIDCFNYNAPPK